MDAIITTIKNPLNEKFKLQKINYAEYKKTQNEILDNEFELVPCDAETIQYLEEIIDDNLELDKELL